MVHPMTTLISPEILDLQVKEIEQAVKQANSKEAKFIRHEIVAEWLSSWGTEDEKEFPGWE